MKCTLIALVLLVATAQAAKLTFFSDSTCDTKVDSSYFTVGKCKEVGEDGSAQGVCVSKNKNSNWTLVEYSDDDCNTATTTAEGSGTECAGPFDIFGINDVYIKIDCGAESCFPGDALVTLESGRKVPFGQLKVGDSVLSVDESGKLVYDRVFRRSSWHKTSHGEFLRFTTAGGHHLTVAGGHYVHANECCSLDTAILAQDIKIGDVIFVVGENGLVPEEVVGIQEVDEKGVFNVHTLNGNIVVNGVAASHFTTDTTWSRKSYAPYWYQMVNAWHRLMGTEPAADEE